MTAQSSYQISLLQHTLGINEHTREPYRNHFVAGPGHHDQKHLEQLESAGLMERGRSPSFLPAGDVVFRVTDAGRALALASLPEPKKRTRYEEYLRADGCAGDSFGEFLCGGLLPKYEWRSHSIYGWYPADPELKDWRGYIYRMYREDAYGRHEIEGKWCKTKKEAKASYKAALKARKQTEHEWSAA